MKKNLSDQELYKEFLDGNQEAFNIIVKRHENNLIYFIMKYVNSLESSEDIAQESFLYIFKTKKEYDFKYSFKTYLYTIAKSRAINYLKNRKENIQFDENNVNLLSTDIDNILIENEEKEGLMRTINTLKSDYKMVIYLKDIHGFTYKEISKILDKTPSQIKMLIHRARKELRNRITKNNSMYKIFINFIIISIFIGSIAYASIIVYNNFIQKETKTDFKNNPDYYDYAQDMQHYDGIYYKKIETYNNYLIDLKKWSGLVEMTEKDFENSFVVVIAGENYHTTGLYISNISADTEILHIDLNKKDTYDGSTIISTKVSKDLNRPNIIVHNNPNVPNMSTKYIKIEDIPKDYSQEQAIADGCFVISANQVISNNRELFNTFIENCNNGIDGILRVYEYQELTNCVQIIDIECKNKIINTSRLNITFEGNHVVYSSGNKINSNGNTYSISDEIGNSKILFSFES